MVIRRGRRGVRTTTSIVYLILVVPVTDASSGEIIV